MKGQYIDSLNHTESGSEVGDVAYIIEIVGYAGDQHETHPHGPRTIGQTTGKCQYRFDLHAGEAAMPFGIPPFDIE
jgi:hypothetical protein